MPAKSPKSALPKDVALVLGVLSAKARGKKAYGKAREYSEALKKLNGKKPVVLPDGRKFSIVDTFDGVDLAKKMVFIDRFELQELK